MTEKSIFREFIAALRRDWKKKVPLIRPLNEGRGNLPKASTFYAGCIKRSGQHVYLYFQHSSKAWQVGRFTINIVLSANENNPQNILWVTFSILNCLPLASVTQGFRVAIRAEAYAVPSSSHPASRIPHPEFKPTPPSFPSPLPIASGAKLRFGSALSFHANGLLTWRNALKQSTLIIPALENSCSEAATRAAIGSGPSHATGFPACSSSIARPWHSAFRPSTKSASHCDSISFDDSVRE